MSVMTFQRIQFANGEGDMFKKLLTKTICIFSFLILSFPAIVIAEAEPEIALSELSVKDVAGLFSGQLKTDLAKKKRKRRCRLKKKTSDLTAKMEAGECVGVCAFAAAFAFVECHAFACVDCPQGVSFCATADSFAYGYASAWACVEACTEGVLPEPELCDDVCLVSVDGSADCSTPTPTPTDTSTPTPTPTVSPTPSDSSTPTPTPTASPTPSPSDTPNS